MAFGFESYTDQGDLIFSTERLNTIVLGTINTASQTGSYTVPAGVEVKHLWASGKNLGVGSYHHTNVWVSGRTIHWTSTGDWPRTMTFGAYV